MRDFGRNSRRPKSGLRQARRRKADQLQSGSDQRGFCVNYGADEGCETEGNEAANGFT